MRNSKGHTFTQKRKPSRYRELKTNLSLLFRLYKPFTKIITKKLTNKFGFRQSVEQAGFRKSCSLINHLQPVKTSIEKYEEYKHSLYLCFEDYQKTFDTVERWAKLKNLQNARINSRCPILIENIFSNATIQVKLDEENKTYKILVKYFSEAIR